MGPSIFVGGDKAMTYAHKAILIASMGPSIFVDGDPLTSGDPS